MHSHLVARLKKDLNYISTPPLGLRGLFWGELYLTVLYFSELTTIRRGKFSQNTTINTWLNDGVY